MNMISFDSGKVPAAIAAMFGNTADELLGNSAGGGFPNISIKGKNFHIQRGDERTLITKPGEDDPAASIEVVIVRANPNRSKVFYAEGYVEGETAKPTCYSNNGISPEADAQEPQSKKCATCVHNQWGARITSDGRKGKSCADSRRLAIAQVDAPGDPMLLRVPAASMKALEEFAKQLSARNVPSQAVVTKIGFDHKMAYPSLTFKPVGLIGDADLLGDVKRIGESEIVAQIIGLKSATGGEQQYSEEEELPVIAAPAPKVAAPEAKPATKPAAQKGGMEEALAAAPVAKKTVRVEQVAAPAAAAAKSASIEETIEGMLDDLGFDD